MKTIRFTPLVACLLACTLAQAGTQTDSVRAVHRKICFDFSPKSGDVLTVKAGDSTVSLSQAAPCLDSSLSFQSFSAEWVSAPSLDLHIIEPLTLLYAGAVGNDSVVPSANALRSETWLFTVNGGYMAPTFITRNFSEADSSWEEMTNIDYLWPSTQTAEVAGKTLPSLALRSAQGRSVTLSVPAGESALLRVYTLSGRVLESRVVAAGTENVVLSSAPPAGSLVELRRGSERTLRVMLP